MEMNDWTHEEVEFFDNHRDEYLIGFYDDPGWKVYREVAGKLAHRCRVQSVLDLGSGPAPSVPILYDRAENYVCVEPASANLEHLGTRFPKAQVHQATAEQLPELDLGPFDLSISFGLLHHIENPAEVITACAEKLKPGGFLLAHEPSSYWNGKMGSPNERGFEREYLRALISSRFQILRFRTYHHPVLRRVLYRLFAALRLLRVFKSLMFWRLVLSVERALDVIGIFGTDYLILARLK
jgi:SAM-dependent methyltransferase